LDVLSVEGGLCQLRVHSLQVVLQALDDGVALGVVALPRPAASQLFFKQLYLLLFFPEGAADHLFDQLAAEVASRLEVLPLVGVVPVYHLVEPSD
jgi:hypothetical protein